MKCKYRLTEEGKSSLKSTAMIAIMVPIVIILAMLSFMAMLIAIAYPFVDTSTDSIWIHLAAWLTYIFVLIVIVVRSKAWLEANTERCK